MAETLDELKAVLTETLEARGMLNKLRAQVRANVYQILDETSDTAARAEDLCDENLFINDLIREYLHWNGYRNTLSVFHPETGQPETAPFDRKYSAGQLHIRETETSKKVPLLYSVVDILKNGPHALNFAEVPSEQANENISLGLSGNSDWENSEKDSGKLRRSFTSRESNTQPLSAERGLRRQSRGDVRLSALNERRMEPDAQNRNRGISRHGMK